MLDLREVVFVRASKQSRQKTLKFYANFYFYIYSIYLVFYFFYFFEKTYGLDLLKELLIVLKYFCKSSLLRF